MSCAECDFDYCMRCSDKLTPKESPRPPPMPMVPANAPSPPPPRAPPAADSRQLDAHTEMSSQLRWRVLHYVGSATLAAESGGGSLPTIRAGSYWTGTLESEDFQLLLSRRDGRSLEGVGVWPHGATRLEGTVYEHEGGSLTFDLTEVELLVPLEEDGGGAAASSSKQRKLPRNHPRL